MHLSNIISSRLIPTIIDKSFAWSTSMDYFHWLMPHHLQPQLPVQKISLCVECIIPPSTNLHVHRYRPTKIRRENQKFK